ncbi:MAG: D-2-hydroxyacid dehydrogenase [Bacteroidia bacterium]|nr:D-2-hydroxyacid dehydrogenase [Bacteroidia bacterium]
MARVLANDGIDDSGRQILTEAGIEVVTDKIAQENLNSELKNFDGVLVRSATQIPKDIIDSAPSLKVIGRAGVGMDNIDVIYAREKGIRVVNTPEASSDSVAELVMANMFTIARGLHIANRKMPKEGSAIFKDLKKDLSKGAELHGKTLGIIGFGRIGKALARMAIAQGMKVITYSIEGQDVMIHLKQLDHLGIDPVKVKVNAYSKDTVLENSDFLSLHVSHATGSPALIGKEELSKMKDGSYIINASRGGVVDENELIKALDSGKIAAAALDVFENEPTPSKKILNHPKISLSPHIGASTKEAQKRIGIEIANKFIQALK